jgi:hypothetical protein
MQLISTNKNKPITLLAVDWSKIFDWLIIIYSSSLLYPHSVKGQYFSQGQFLQSDFPHILQSSNTSHFQQAFNNGSILVIFTSALQLLQNILIAFSIDIFP